MSVSRSVCAVAALVVACLPHPAHAGGIASWYDCKVPGECSHHKITASGERFNADAMTAAHRSLPFGTKVKVTCRRTGKSVTVRINDRGPFVRGRVIDLSREAARRLGMDGLAPVNIQVVGRDS